MMLLIKNRGTGSKTTTILHPNLKEVMGWWGVDATAVSHCGGEAARSWGFPPGATAVDATAASVSKGTLREASIASTQSGNYFHEQVVGFSHGD